MNIIGLNNVHLLQLAVADVTVFPIRKSPKILFSHENDTKYIIVACLPQHSDRPVGSQVVLTWYSTIRWVADPELEQSTTARIKDR